MDHNKDLTVSSKLQKYYWRTRNKKSKEKNCNEQCNGKKLGLNNEQCKKISKSIALLRKAKDFVSQEELVKIYNSLFSLTTV